MKGLRGHICFNFGRIIRQSHLAWAKAMAPFGLTPPQYFVFYGLWLGDGITLKELGDRVCIDPSTLTGVIDRMEKIGYLERRQNPEDRRSVLVYLTDKGHKIGPEILRVGNELDQKLRSHFSKEELESFERILIALAECPEYWE